jgi:N-terminal acetyltransferase B complex catalytic subunit
MSTIRPMRAPDLLRITTTNLDPLTETYNISFYLEYLTKWPDLCRVIEGINGGIEGYSTPRPLSQQSRSYRPSAITNVQQS